MLFRMITKFYMCQKFGKEVQWQYYICHQLEVTLCSEVITMRVQPLCCRLGTGLSKINGVLGPHTTNRRVVLKYTCVPF